MLIAPYLSIERAVEYLTVEHSAYLNFNEMLVHARREEFRLCAHITGQVALCSKSKENESYQPFWIEERFDGYIHIPGKAVMHYPEKISINNPANIIEIHDSFWKTVKLPEPNLSDYRALKVNAQNPDDGEDPYTPFAIDFCDMLIPKQDLLDFVTRIKNQSTDTTQTNIPELGAKPIKEGGRMNFAIYQKLRASCMKYIGQYINAPEHDATRRMFCKDAGGEPLGRLEFEKQGAISYFQNIDLEPREVAASYLLGIISNHRKIAWLREPTPPYGHEQLQPLEKTEDNALTHQTNQAVSEYVQLLPDNEKAALWSAWEYSLAPKSTQDTAKPELEISKTNPWEIVDPRDPEPEHTWYTAARYFARQLVKENPTLLNKKDRLAQKVVQSLTGVGIKKRGGKKPFNPGTVKKAFHNVNLG